jgi:AraC-like DNA-binding protein
MLSTLESFLAGSFTLLAFVLYTRQKPVNQRANNWFAFFLCLVAIMIFDKGLYEQGFYQAHSQWVGLTDMILFFLAPIFYLTVEYFVSVNKRFSKKDFIHFVIPLLSIPPALQFLFSSVEVKEKALGSLTSTLSGINPILFVQIVFYWFFALWRIQKHQKSIQLFASSTEHIDLNWLKYLLLGVAGIILIFITDYYAATYWVAEYTSWGYVLVVYFLAYYALRQEEIFPFSNQSMLEIREIIEESQPEQRHQRLSDANLQALKTELLTLMTNEKLYLDDTLNLPKLAQQMSISTHDLSYLLNIGFGNNFFQFVNAYRVQEAKRLLLSQEHKHLNMVGIAYAAGFSSKTTFYAAFKKMTDQSPTEFQNTGKVEV